MFNRSQVFGFFLAYLLFIVYGSLIPFEYRAYTFDQALAQFAGIRYLDLGLASRADWIANIILYIPLSFLACLWLAGAGRRSTVDYLVLPLVLALVLVVALSVEFTQIFFAPRTVSINDLIAETLGGLGGMALWLFGRDWLAHLWRSFRDGGHQSIVAMLSVYSVFYISQSLFPFDFVVSTAELGWKLDSDNYGFLIAGDCESLLRCLARLLGEAVAIVPLGILAALAYPTFGLDSGGGLRRVLLIGALLGVLLEFVQFFTASGVSQGLSVLMRSFGLGMGVFIGHILRQLGAGFLARTIRQFTPWLLLPYLLALVALAGWFNAAWRPLTEFSAGLADVRVMPFYYHYYSTEPQAMASLLANMTMYLPLGLAMWAGRTVRANTALRLGRSRNINYRKGALRLTAAAAMGLALLVELGKVLVPAKHPDFTNLLIAAVAAVLTYAFMRWLEGALLDKPADKQTDKQALAVARPAARKSQETAARPELKRSRTVDSSADISTDSSPAFSLEPLADSGLAGRDVAPPSGPSTIGLLYTLPLMAAIGLGVYGYPLLMPLLVLALLVYGALLWRWPLLWFFVLPLLLPLLDFSQHTGQLALDEFDLFVLMTLLIGTLRGGRSAPLPWPNPLLPMVLALLWLSWLLSTLPQLWPLLGGADLRQPGSHSPIAAWMVGKGLLWALLLVPLIRRTPGEQLARARQCILWSLSAGLVCLSLVVMAQRHAFVGLTDFDNIFRVTGTFSSMNTGGAYIEAYIALAFPALLLWVLSQRAWWWRLWGLIAVAMAVYAMLVTYSRVGYVALALGFTVVLLAWVGKREALARGKKLLVFVGLLLAGVAVLTPLVSAGFAQYRLARSADDFTFRLHHWQQAVGLMNEGVLSKIVGDGFGQYPIHHLLYTDEGEIASRYRLKNEAGLNFLQMRAGKTAYLEQIVDIEPNQHYQLSLRLRRPEFSPLDEFGAAASSAKNTALTAFVCEKALLYSFGCIRLPVELAAVNSRWADVVLPFDSGQLGSGFWPRRPVKLSLLSASGVVDIDAVRLTRLTLTRPGGDDVLANGDFADGTKHWLFVTDQDLAWHIHQQWLEVYFAQGLLGIIALVLLLLLLARVLYRPVLQGDLVAAAFAAALMAFLTVGLLGSTLDSARSAMLFYLMVFCVIVLSTTQRRSNEAHSQALGHHKPGHKRE